MLLLAIVALVAISSWCLSTSLPQQHTKGLQALGVAAMSIAGLEFTHPGTVMALLNPFALPPTILAPVLLFLGPLDHVRYFFIQAFVSRYFTSLPLRQQAPSKKGLRSFECIDYFYMAINSTFLMAPFAMRMVYFAIHPPSGVTVSWSLEEVSFRNTLLALLVIFVVADMYYWCLHRAMHVRAFYPYVHKHHHRQVLPERGFADAINEHPIEQFCGMATLWAALYTTARITQLHAVVPVVYFLALSALSTANHTNLDIKIPFPMEAGYSVRAHEMHHRYPDCNMAQYMMVYDKLMGTFRPYKAE